MSRPIAKLLPRHTNSKLASVLILISILLVVMAIGTPTASAKTLCTLPNRAGENSVAAVLLRLAQSPQTANPQRENSIGRYDSALSDTLAANSEILTQSIGDLRSAGMQDAHHVIQDAAVRDLLGYDTSAAPGVQLEGPSTSIGTPHYNATQIQRLAGGGTYGAERRIAYNALRAAGYTDSQATQAIQEADRYFNSIGVNENTLTRIPGNRR